MATFELVEEKQAPKLLKHATPCKCRHHRPRPVLLPQDELAKLMENSTWAIRALQKSNGRIERGETIQDKRTSFTLRHGTPIKVNRKRGRK